MGILVALGVLGLWFSHLVYMFLYLDFSFSNPIMYLHILLQSYLYTGLFITGHDAMHGTISRYKPINNAIGFIAVLFYAGMYYPKLKKNHMLHHKAPATEKDPDFHTQSQNFWIWWFVFMWRYLTLIQFVIMGIIFNILTRVLGFGEIQSLMFWALPAILGTFQLFYFGVYWPHKKPHKEDMMPHRARTQKKNHLWALISCYFFGYHFEHHEKPGVPWWHLYTQKKIPKN